jgi:dinuclear metal center YbgI/SA1388 family protein
MIDPDVPDNRSDPKGGEMPATVREVMELMEVIAPRRFAEPGDPVGLHAGDPRARVRKLLCTLDADAGAVRAARRGRCQMIVAHHPRFYRPLPDLDERKPLGRLAAEIARAKLAVFSAHTNLDTAPGGVNDCLAEAAGLGEARPLVRSIADPLEKLVAFVPPSHLDAVRRAVCDAGAGAMGEYTDCTFRTPGTGTFRPSAQATPYLGERQAFTEVEELRLESILPASARERVIAALRAAHPYEEPAFDILSMPLAERTGLGRTGPLRKPVTLAGLARRLKRATGGGPVLVYGDPKAKAATCATWAGAGCRVGPALEAGVDALVTGEIGHHDLERLAAAGVGVVVLGHGPSEALVLEPLAASLREGLPEVSVEVYADNVPVPTVA